MSLSDSKPLNSLLGTASRIILTRLFHRQKKAVKTGGGLSSVTEAKRKATG